jgi:iron complex outermembrane receptor protein
MGKSRIIPSSIALGASLFTFGLTANAQQQPAGPQQAQAPQSQEQQDADVVVVTGSILRGTPEDAALPVDVLTSDELQLQGSPSNTDIIKALPFVGATIAGDANPLGASRVQGASSINLRGLGNSRTLVLLNGRRLAPITSGTQTLIDTNSLPMAAVQRVEVLKDGGAATYGSDAIAGVVNFITATNYRGLEFNGNYSFIDGSDGDYTLTSRWGFGTETTDVLFSAGYTHRSELDMADRDFAYRPYLENPTGWSTSSNPGIYSVGNTAAAAVSFLDPGCEAAGGQLTPLAAVGTARNCLSHYIGYENLVDEQDMFHVYGQVTTDLGDHAKFNIEGLYSQINVNNVETAPSSTVLNPPSTRSTGGPATGVIPTRFFIPASNPGLQDLLARYSAAQLGLTTAQYTSAQTVGVNAFGNWRPLDQAGNLGYEGEGKIDHRNFTIYRISGGFSGDQILGYNIDWDLNSTFASAEADSTGADVLVSRLQYALRGLGGPNCTPGGAVAATSTPGVGPCSYFNPFSTGIQTNGLTGAANSTFVGHANTAELERWMFNDGGGVTTNETLTFEGVISGKVEGFSLPGGQIAWGVGAQYRRNRVIVTAQPLSNFLINPCTDEGLALSTCAADPRGLGGIFGPTVPRDYDQEVKGVYGEIGLPIFDNLDVQLALRTEWHDAGDTTNPRASVRWQIIDGLALRASAQSTYRAPPAAFLDPSIITQISQQIGVNRVAFDSTGNADLRPETSDNLNFGVITDFGGFSATLDYWSFKLTDQLVLEDSASLVNALFPATGPNNCGNPAFADLQARFTFQAGGCTTVANIARVRRQYTNGAKVDASGIDLSMKYAFGQVGPGELDLGLDLTYNIEYNTDSFSQFGITLSQAFDAVGLLNVNIDPRSMPQWRGQFSANYAIGDHNFRWLSHYVSSVRDQRAGTGSVNDPLLPVAGFPTGTRVPGGVTTGVQWTHDFFYTWDFSDKTTFTASIVNVFDEDPPLTRNEYSYDPFTASPLGRVFKVGVRQAF